MWSKVFREGLGAVREILIRNKMKIVFETVNQSASGDDAFIAADGNALEIKKMAVSLESGHPLGRLWDIDVFDAGGGLVGRETLGKEKRRCLICGDQVALCRRAGKHDVGEVIERMERICQSYFNDDPER
jgi:holo-ACP synthase CitX